MTFVYSNFKFKTERNVIVIIWRLLWEMGMERPEIYNLIIFSTSNSIGIFPISVIIIINGNSEIISSLRTVDG